MRTVKIGDLKAHLSAHLRSVRNGGEVLVCDRNQPIARIIPVDLENYSEHERRLIASGAMTPPKRKRKANERWPKPPGKVPIPHDVMERIWREERDGR